MSRVKAKKAARRARKPQAEKPLPLPVDPGAQNLPAMEQEKPSGLFNLGAIFGEKPNPQPSGEGGKPSWNSSIGNGEPMAADAARLLGSVPDVIGSEDGTARTAESADAPAAPMILPSAVIISADTMQHLLLWLTDKLAVWRRIDAYRLNDAGAAMLAGPYSQVLNGLWDKLAPAFLSQLCVSVPGLAEAAALSAVAFWPAIQEEMKRSSARRGAIPQKPVQPAPAQPAQPARGGMIYEGGKAE